MPADPPADTDAALVDRLLIGGRHAAAHQLPGLIAAAGPLIGGRDAVAYLADLQQQVLVPFVGSATLGEGRRLSRLTIDGTLAGRTFQLLEILPQSVEDGVRLWLPLLDGSERLGVLGLTLPDWTGTDGLLTGRLQRFAALVADLVVAKTSYGDSIIATRRREAMGLAAEMQWALLPPLTFQCDQVAVAGALEPAYEVAGDSLDYAVDAGAARLAVFDGMGHGLHSAQLAALAVAAYRNARRSGRSLPTTAAHIDTAVTTGFPGEAFTTAVLAELDTDTGLLSWINAGHPEPLLIRDGRFIHPLHTTPGLPFGLGLPGTAEYPVGREQLQPGDRIVLHTDGVPEARSPDGEFFGEQRLSDLLVRHLAGELPVAETLRRIVTALLDHQQGQLTDDATLLLLEWPGTSLL